LKARSGEACVECVVARGACKVVGTCSERESLACCSAAARLIEDTVEATLVVAADVVTPLISERAEVAADVPA